MRYDQTAIPSCYNQSRRLPHTTMTLWLDAITGRVHRDEIATMEAHGFEPLSHDVLRQKFADTLEEYYEKVSQRALSDLAAISDVDFHAGLKQMAEAARREDHNEGVYEPVDLFVFRRS